MKLSVYIAVSLDGFIARENGDIDWLPQPVGENDGEDYGYKAFFNSVDVLVMGRNTYEKVLSFGEWPYGNKRVIVLSSENIKIPADLSDTLKVRNCKPAELVEELSMAGVKKVYIDGGRTIQSFINADLINELIISRIPILIGQGTPLFGQLAHDIKLCHVETRSFDNGIVQSKYTILH